MSVRVFGADEEPAEEFDAFEPDEADAIDPAADAVDPAPEPDPVDP